MATTDEIAEQVSRIHFGVVALGPALEQAAPDADEEGGFAAAARAQVALAIPALIELIDQVRADVAALAPGG